MFCFVWLVGASAMVFAAGSDVGVEAERTRWLELRREIARHDELYFRRGAP